MAKAIRFVGNLFLSAAFLLIFVCSLGVLVNKGLGEFAKLFNLFNIVNYAVMFAVLVPGIALRAWADHIEKNKS